MHRRSGGEGGTGEPVPGHTQSPRLPQDPRPRCRPPGETPREEPSGGLSREPPFSTCWWVRSGHPLPGRPGRGHQHHASPALPAAGCVAVDGSCHVGMLLPQGYIRGHRAHSRPRPPGGCAHYTWRPCAGLVFPVTPPQVGVLLPKGWHSPGGAQPGLCPLRVGKGRELFQCPSLTGSRLKCSGPRFDA